MNAVAYVLLGVVAGVVLALGVVVALLVPPVEYD